MKNLFLLSTTLLIFSSCKSPDNGTSKNDFLSQYQGTPYTDQVRATGIQVIPGKIECEFFDFGGENIAYLDNDANNNGSGNLNKGEGYLANFRINEAPDISYTKFFDSIDNSRYNFVEPEKEQLYIGWTEPGEWTRYTVDVRESGNYNIGTMYTSNRGGTVRLIIDNTDSTDLMHISSTFHEEDPVAWRQWHHWNYSDSITTLFLEKGKHVVTFKITGEGNFNFDFLQFTKSKKQLSR